MLSIIPHIKSATIGDILYLIKISHTIRQLNMYHYNTWCSLCQEVQLRIELSSAVYKTAALPLSYWTEWNVIQTSKSCFHVREYVRVWASGHVRQHPFDGRDAYASPFVHPYGL